MMKQLSKILIKAKEIAGILTIVSLFLTVVSGAYLLLVGVLDAGFFSYACLSFVSALAAYFLIELYQKSKS